MADRMRTCGDAGRRNLKGEPCRSWLNLGPSGLCIHHDPSRAEEARAMRVKGAKAKAVAVRMRKAANPVDVPRAPKTLEDAAEFASWLTHAVTVGLIDARTGHEAAYSLRAFQALCEKRDLEKEVEALRAELAEARRRPGRVGVA